MKELEKLNILRVNKTDHNNMFYFFIQTLQFNFNFENWQFKKVFSFSFYTIQVCQGLLIGIYCQRFVAPNDSRLKPLHLITVTQPLVQ